MTDTADLMMSAVIGEGIALCGIAPRVRLTTLTDWECFNCHEKKVVRCFSGSGWYSDDAICAACGEDNQTGYRPFQRAWRKKNIAIAEEWLATALPLDEYYQETGRLIRIEMGE